jgi:hypothetical protein
MRAHLNICGEPGLEPPEQVDRNQTKELNMHSFEIVGNDLIDLNRFLSRSEACLLDISDYEEEIRNIESGRLQTGRPRLRDRRFRLVKSRLRSLREEQLALVRFTEWVIGSWTKELLHDIQRVHG